MHNELEQLRTKIDVVDHKITTLLAERFALTHKVGLYKAKHHLSAFSKQRETEIFKAKKSLAKKLGLNEALIEKIFKSIIATVRREHRAIALAARKKDKNEKR